MSQSLADRDAKLSWRTQTAGSSTTDSARGTACSLHAGAVHVGVLVQVSLVAASGSGPRSAAVTSSRTPTFRVPAGRPREAVHHRSRRRSARFYAGWVKRAWPVTRAALSLAVWPLTIALSPVILVAGEPVNRYVMRRVRRSAAAGPATVTGHGDGPGRAVLVRLSAPASLLWVVISNPLWIALTAPGRWAGDRFRRPPSMPAGTAAR